jgi:photosystem II stability/assembly factor-like uncharacterized protein
MAMNISVISFAQHTRMTCKRAHLNVLLLTSATAFAMIGMASMAQAQVNPAVLPITGSLSKQTMSRLLLNDAARIGNRVVAVGDRGYIVVSDSNGENWERAQTPANVPMLTAVYFADAKNGWAVGHDAVILKTVDEGSTWTQAFAAATEQKPLMDIVFTDANTGFAVGAYGAFYATVDGGKSWNPRKVSEEDKHLNAIVKIGEGKLLIVGEAGTLLRSDDAGKTWGKLESPYKGSFFGAIQAADGAVIIYGLRGRIFVSTDPSLKNWTQVENKSTASVMGATRLPDGALVLAGLAGTALLSRDNGRSFTALATGSTKGISVPLLGAPNAILLFGETGARDILASALGVSPAPVAPPAAPKK